MAGSFALDIGRFVKKANGNADLVVRKISLDLFRRVILKSPVDTGRFRGNWQVAIGKIPDAVLDVEDKSGMATMSKATAAAAGVKAGDVIYLVNNLPYARALEYGSSKQAPAGVVRVTVAEYQGVVANAVSGLK